MRINKLKKGYNCPNLITYDVETITDNGQLKFNLGVVTAYNLSMTCFDSDSLTKVLLSACEKRKINYVIAHNAQFDFAFLNHDIFSNFELMMFSVNPFIVHFRYRDNPEYRNTTSLIFIDSMSFFKNSLDELGKIFGREKFTIDILRNSFASEISEYCKQDTLIVWDIMKFIDSQAEKYDIEFPVTFAQMSYLIYRKNFLNISLVAPDMAELMLLEREGYFGGRVEVFDFSRVKMAKVYDINSLYPSVMHDNFFPIQPIQYFSKENCENNKVLIMTFLSEEIAINSLIMARVVVKIDDCFIGPIPKRLNGKLIFPTGTFETVLCTPELKLVQDNIVEVKEVIKYAKDKIFANFVDTFYNERMKFDKKHPNHLFYKLVMNSLYGKFGQRRFEFLRFPEFDNILKYGSTDLNIDDNEETIKVHFFNGYAYSKEIFYDNPRAFVSIAAFVTSYARVALYKSMLKNQDTLLYCDTDSMITKDEISNIKIGSELGEWKLEKTYSNFQCKGNKHYVSLEERKVKGVPKDAELLDDYSFKFEKITKMKESIVRFKEPKPRVVTMIKHYNSDYDKRIKKKDNTTCPLFLKLEESL